MQPLSAIPRRRRTLSVASDVDEVGLIMFEKFRTNPQIAAALKPIEAISPELAQRCVRYVQDGSGAEVVLELLNRKDQAVNDILIHPGHYSSWGAWISDDVKKKLKELGLTEQQLRIDRQKFYNYKPAPERLVRMGRLLAAVSTKVNRTSPQVPEWLTALLNDLVMTQPRANKSGSLMKKTFPDWTPYRIAELLLTDDPTTQAVPIRVISAIFTGEPDSYNRLPTRNLPGIGDYVAEFGEEIPTSELSKLSAIIKSGLVEDISDHAGALTALVPAIAVFTTDTAKSVRIASLEALRPLDPTRQAEAFRPVLAAVKPARAADLLSYLAATEWGLELLNEAAANGASVAPAVAKLNERQQALSHTESEVELVLPDYQPLPTAGADDQIAAELRRWLAKEIVGGEKATEKWQQNRATRAGRITDADIDAFISIADGTNRPGAKSALLKAYDMWTVARAVPSLSLAQLLRLDLSNGGHRSLRWVAQFRINEDTDLRAISDVCAQLGNDDTWVSDLLHEVSYQAAWPWFARRPELIHQRLLESAAGATTALRLLAQFPALPAAFLPTVAAIAMGDSKVNRPLAQDLLASHPSARILAEQGLADGKSEVRTAAARWLAKIGEPAGIEALEKALAKEKREGVRAALLTALESLGADIGERLSPTVLFAEASKGLKGKPPASMGWFLNLELPAVRWADGTPVDPLILRWWTVLATKMKNPDGSGLLDLYLGLLEPSDAAGLSSFVLRAWIAQDTRHPDPDESRAFAETDAQQRYQDAQDWLARARKEQRDKWLEYAEEGAAVPLEQHFADAYRYHQSQFRGSAAADKGLLALTTKTPGIELANAVANYIRNDGSRRAQVEYLVHTLYANGQPAAVQLLLSISRRHKQATVQAKAGELIERLADDRGWSADELADRTIPTAGFSEDQLLHLDFGPREFLGRITAKGGIELSDAAGKAVKSLPSPRNDDDPELVAAAKKQLTTSRKELKSVLSLQTSRLYEAMCAQRGWPMTDWTEFLAGHPLLATLISRLVWLEDVDGRQRSFRPTEDGSLIDVNDELVTLSEQAEIRLAHRTLLSPAEVEAWQQHLSDYDVVSLFEQFGPPAPQLTGSAVEFTDLAGHLTETFKFRNIATKRGYTRGQAEDAGWFSEYTKAFTGLKLTAVIEFTGSFVPEENITCATEKLYFRRGRGKVKLANVPPILVAECYADYAALAALGPYDADYQSKAQY
jgi:hypothetical protein